MDHKQTETEFQLKWFDLAIEEYNSLRNESANSLNNQQSIINYGLTAIGVLIAFSANLWLKERIVESIYVIFVPFMCNLIILIWNGEVRRMSRAGQYIKQIEDKVHKELSAKSGITERALDWETFLRKPIIGDVVEKKANSKFNRVTTYFEQMYSFLFKKDPAQNSKLKSNYIAIIIMFGGLSILSLTLGFVHNFLMVKEATLYGGMELWSAWFTIDLPWIISYTVLLIVNILCFIYHYRYFQHVKK